MACIVGGTIARGCENGSPIRGDLQHRDHFISYRGNVSDDYRSYSDALRTAVYMEADGERLLLSRAVSMDGTRCSYCFSGVIESCTIDNRK